MRGTGQANIREGSKQIMVECESLEQRAAEAKVEVEDLSRHVKSFEDFVDSHHMYVVESYDHRMYLFATVELLRQKFNRAEQDYKHLLKQLEKSKL